jgi:putative phosphoribosyl transferase
MFKDRADAARKLSEALSKYKDQDPVILAIPRGGVAIGYPIAKELNAPLDVSLSKKIGHPSNKEFAIGAISLHGAIINKELDIPEKYLEKEVERVKEQIKENYKIYRGGKPPVSIEGKTAIIVDDGIATGSTMLATIELIKSGKPKKIIVAVPVAPPSAQLQLEGFIDEFICLVKPIEFGSVGRFYETFEQLTDKDVIPLLHEQN